MVVEFMRECVLAFFKCALGFAFVLGFLIMLVLVIGMINGIGRTLKKGRHGGERRILERCRRRR